MRLFDGASSGVARRAAALALAAACGVSLLETSAQAVPQAPDPGREKNRVDAQVERLENQVDDTGADLSAAYRALQQTQARMPTARSALTKAQAASGAADRANTVAAQDLEVARANEAKTERELTAATAAVTANRTRVAQFASQIYQEQGFGQLDMALSSTGPQQFADRLALVDAVMDVQDRTMQRLTTEQASLTALEDRLAALRADFTAKKKAAEAALARAESARAAAAKAKADLEALAVDQTAQAATLNERLAGEKQELAAMEAEQTRLRTLLARRAAEARKRAAAARKSRGLSGGGGSGGGGGRSDDGWLSYPMSAGLVSSEYGMRLHPILGYRKLHTGRDFAAPCGAPVKAAADGVIISAGYGGGYGNRIVVDHGAVGNTGLATTYNHLASIRVSSGRVDRGEVIGYEGSTGRSTGCHLHFEVLQNGDFVDPRRWL
ncbi:MAG: peptidoglycan DD-metalloendopeptidase family protein [Dermatophilaceae bacterium]